MDRIQAGVARRDSRPGRTVRSKPRRSPQAPRGQRDVARLAGSLGHDPLNLFVGLHPCSSATAADRHRSPGISLSQRQSPAGTSRRPSACERQRAGNPDTRISGLREWRRCQDVRPAGEHPLHATITRRVWRTICTLGGTHRVSGRSRLYNLPVPSAPVRRSAGTPFIRIRTPRSSRFLPDLPLGQSAELRRAPRVGVPARGFSIMFGASLPAAARHR